MATLIAPNIRSARRLVVKIGSALLVDPETGLKRGWLAALALDVAEAIATSGAPGVDVSSGVERARGIKDPAAIAAFIANAKAARA